MQVAVLGADVGGQAELVTPDCGILLKPAGAAREIEAYAGKLAWLIEHPGERRAMAERARDRIVQHFTLDNMGARIDALLREIPARTRTFGQAVVPPSPDPRDPRQAPQANHRHHRRPAAACATTAATTPA